ncbi:MAG: GtrA family protein [Lewinellaceae bacterium]|nr:GtrA family protein [Lewinella sp.]MCB9279498.1 GtrA family protein [Lewinellaceae bacterium]HMQ89054.1 GtrA family protein [Flavilitoribacter sp.]
MSVWVEKIWPLFKLKARYATTSAMATAAEYGIYAALIYWLLLQPTAAHVISYTCSMLINFVLQRFFVFDVRRKVRTVFLIAALVSLGAITLSSVLFIGLTSLPFFAKNHFLAKGIATGIVFFYNFYLKRYAFEKRFL